MVENIQKEIDLLTKNRINSKVLVGLSGGVDSAVTAWMLKEAGFDVQAVFLKCYPNVPGCRSEADLKDAIKVASKLGISLITMDYIKQYREEVLENFYQEYKKGRTPNPDILCNQHIKFGAFFDEAMETSSADFYATGHYVRSTVVDGRQQLFRGSDEHKDQSYFLYRIPQSALEKTIFPLGNLHKDQIRSQAEELKLIVSDKPDSTGICFIGEVDLIDFLSERIPVEPGDVVLADGTVVGSHKGVWFYTYGQRRGFETKVNEPLYVLQKDLEKNVLVVGDLERTYSESFTVEDVLLRVPVEGTFEAGVRIRNLGKIIPATIQQDNSNQYLVSLSEPIQAVSPGQSAVFYQKDMVVGGGTISDYSYIKG